MSVESNFSLRCQDKKQVEAAEQYPVNLTGRGQKYPISEEMEVDGNDIELYNCLCIDDFDKYLIDWCIYIAENTPNLGFDADGEFTEDTDGYTIIHKIKYDNETLTVETSSGYEDYDEDDWNEEDNDNEEGGMCTTVSVYKLVDGKMIVSK